MLNVETQFPQVGSKAFLRRTAEPVRILERAPQRDVLVQRLVEDRSRGATMETRVPLADLAETAELACEAPVRRRRRSAR